MMLFDKATRKIIYKVEQLYGKNSKEINYEKLENNIIAAQELPVEILEQLLKQKLGSKND